ncbi:hypothetical protein [Streptomyces sp. NWU339]|uniref:hypothetical protein n=1 Tax=Streptomyces sp. NWU339 TaxID=2185284 RepID=UPI0015E8198A
MHRTRPRRPPVIERACLPTEQEIERAERIVKAAVGERGARALPDDGCSIDAAVVTAAQCVLSPARRV